MPGVTMTCEDWSAYFGTFEHTFELHLAVDGWLPSDSGIYKSKWLDGHGIAPFASPAGSGNFSCMEAETTAPFVRQVTEVQIGLETPYEVACDVQIVLRRAETGTPYIMTQSFAANTDFFGFIVPETDLMDKLTVLVRRSDFSCTIEPTTAPAIRYVVVKGEGTNPFV